MSVKPLTEHHLEFLSLKRGCTGSAQARLSLPLSKCHIVRNLMSQLISQFLGMQTMIGLFVKLILDTGNCGTILALSSVSFLKTCSSLCIRDGQGLFCFYSRSCSELNFKASDIYSEEKVQTLCAIIL